MLKNGVYKAFKCLKCEWHGQAMHQYGSHEQFIEALTEINTHLKDVHQIKTRKLSHFDMVNVDKAYAEATMK